MRAAARGLPADQFALANDYAAFFDAVHDRALQWPKTPRSRLIASHGLARLAKSTPAAAEKALPRFAQALGFTEEDRGRGLYQVALWTADRKSVVEGKSVSGRVDHGDRSNNKKKQKKRYD